tara:strand:+ start:357 stop:773 length:417 start_codon:yes stop_codon:yes gene_type:complete
MATVTLTFANKINISAQVGDTAYYTPTTYVGDDQAQGYQGNAGLGFTTSLKADEVTENIYVNIGTIKSIASNRLSMVVNTSLTTSQIPTDSHFIFFSKDNIANMTTTLGYYAEVVLKNNSTTEAELFSIGCDIFESSK